MIVNCFEINKESKILPIDADRAVEASQIEEERIWIDLSSFNAEELEEWLDKLSVKGLSRRFCLEARNRPGFYPLKNEFFCVAPVLVETKIPGKIDYQTFLIRENLLITISSNTILTSQRLTELKESEDWLAEHSITGLVSGIMVDLSIECRENTVDLRNSIIDLEKQMDREPDTVGIEELVDIRTYLLKLGTVVSEQLPALQALISTNKSFFQSESSKEYMNCALVNLQTADRSLDWLGQRIDVLRSGLQMHGQEKTNKRLNLLTILAAIFNPLTLLAGVWGMNFEVMPELKFTYGYPAALGLMLLVGSGMYIYFRKSGWFE